MRAKQLVFGMVFTCLAGAASISGAGESLAPGDRLRITTAERRREVVLERVLADRLLVREQTSTNPAEISLSGLQSLEIRVPRSRTGGVRRGADLGLASGVLSGVAVGLLSGDDPPQSGNLLELSAGAKAVVLGIAGGLAGVLVGTLVGWAFPGSEWHPVDLPVDLESRGDWGLGVEVGLCTRFW